MEGISSDEVGRLAGLAIVQGNDNVFTWIRSNFEDRMYSTDILEKIIDYGRVNMLNEFRNSDRYYLIRSLLTDISKRTKVMEFIDVSIGVIAVVDVGKIQPAINLLNIGCWFAINEPKLYARYDNCIFDNVIAKLKENGITNADIGTDYDILQWCENNNVDVRDDIIDTINEYKRHCNYMSGHVIGQDELIIYTLRCHYLMKVLLRAV